MMDDGREQKANFMLSEEGDSTKMQSLSGLF
jgi:hypothetical protein